MPLRVRAMFCVAFKVVISRGVFDGYVSSIKILGEQLPAHAMAGASRKRKKEILGCSCYFRNRRPRVRVAKLMDRVCAGLETAGARTCFACRTVKPMQKIGRRIGF